MPCICFPAAFTVGALGFFFVQVEVLQRPHGLDVATLLVYTDLDIWASLPGDPLIKV